MDAANVFPLLCGGQPAAACLFPLHATPAPRSEVPHPTPFCSPAAAVCGGPSGRGLLLLGRLWLGGTHGALAHGRSCCCGFVCCSWQAQTGIAGGSHPCRCLLLPSPAVTCCCPPHLQYGPILLGTVLIHELGHALAARRVGGHADGILLWPLGGLAYVGHDCGPKGAARAAPVHVHPQRQGGAAQERRTRCVGRLIVGCSCHMKAPPIPVPPSHNPLPLQPTCGSRWRAPSPTSPSSWSGSPSCSLSTMPHTAGAASGLPGPQSACWRAVAK